MAWTNAVRIDHGATVYAAPPSDGIRNYAVAGVSAWELTFDPNSPSILDPTISTEIPFTDIAIGGKQLTGEKLVLLPLQTATTDAKPKYTPARKNVDSQQTTTKPVEILMTRSYHPDLTDVSDLKAACERAAEILANDDDTPILNDDPSVKPPPNEGPLYRSDDVPMFRRFVVKDAKQKTFPGLWAMNPRFLTIANEADGIALIKAPFAYIKQVNAITFIDAAGLSITGGSGIILARNSWTGLGIAHEWGHTSGLNHRGATDETPLNPGPPEKAIMRKANVPNEQVEINRAEKGVMGTWRGNTWGQ